MKNNDVAKLSARNKEGESGSRSGGGGGGCGSVVAKQLSKQIYASGKNYKAALKKLFNVYPFLQFPIEEGDDSKSNQNDDGGDKERIKENEGAQVPLIQSKVSIQEEFNVLHLFDASRPICATIDVLGKVNQAMLGLKLLNQIQLLIETSKYGHNIKMNDDDNINHHQQKQQEQKKDNDESLIKSRKNSFLYLVYKSIISMVGQTIPKQQKINTEQNTSSTSIILNGEYILQLLYYDLPKKTLQHQNGNVSPSLHSEEQQQLPQIPIDVYHSTLSALGKSKRMDLIMNVIHDMESNRLIKLNSTMNTSSASSTSSISDAANTNAHIKNNEEQQLQSSSTSSPHAIEYQLPKPDQTSYSTAISAAMRCKAYNESIQILQHMKRNKAYPSILAYNQVLSCISNSGSMFSHGSDERYQLTKKILKELENDGGDGDDQHGVIPTESTYQIVMAIYAKENRWDDVRSIKLKMMKNQSTHSTNGISSAAVSKGKAVAQNNQIDRSARRGSVESIHGTEMTVDATPVYAGTSIVLQHINDLKKLEKMNKKRPIWYKLGKYTADDENSSNDISFMFGIQPHRNPSENGISIVFYEEETEDKLGYMLIRNTRGRKRKRKASFQEGNDDEDFILYSSFMGMYIDENRRGKQLATKFMAIWLLICLKSNALPLTEIINKPLLSLVLNKFDFIPKDKESGIEVEVCPIKNIEDKPKEKNHETGWYPDFAMYSKRIRPDDGTFGGRELRIQKMMITKFQPNPRGKITFVKTSFDHPLLHVFKSSGGTETEAFNKTKNDLIQRIKSVVGGNGLDDGKVSILANNELLRRSVFGFLYETKN